METKKVILIIEDDAGLSELLNEKIQELDCQTACVFSASAAFDWLAGQTPYLILMDYSLPDMTAKEFIDQLKTKADTIPPFILATGQGDERIAVEMMKLGARDYIVKDSHFLEMIPLVVSRVCSEVENEITIKQFEENLRNSEHENKTILETTLDGFWICNPKGQLISANNSFCKMLGYTLDELLTMSIADFEAIDNEQDVLDRAKRIIENGADKFESKHRCKDGRVIDVDVSVRYLAENDILFVFVRDITEKKQTLEVLAESERRFRELLSSVQMISIVLDLNGDITFCNDYFLELTHWKREDVIGINWITHFIPVNQQEILLNLFNEGLSHRKIVTNHENPILDKFGNELLISWNNTTLYDQHCNINGIASLGIDITEHRKAENSIRKSKDRLNRAEYASKSGNWELHLDGMKIKASKGATKLYGLNKNRLEYKEIEHLPLPEYRSMMDAALKNLIEKNEPYNLEFKIKRADTDAIIDVKSSATYDKENRVIFGIIQDITDRKKTEEALRICEERYRMIAENSFDVIWKMTFDGRFTYVSPSVFQLRGYTAEEVLKQTMEEAVCPESIPEIKTELGKALADIESYKKNKNRYFEVNQYHKDGSTVCTEVSVSFIYNELGQPVEVIGASRDITERKRAEEAFHDSQAHYHSFVDHLPAAVFRKDAEGRFIFVNNIFCELKGLTKEDIVGKTPSELRAHEEKIDATRSPERKLRQRTVIEADMHHQFIMQTGKPIIVEEVYSKLDGSPQYLQVVKSPVFDSRKNIIGSQGIQFDITTLKLTERALAEKDREQATMISNLPGFVYRCANDINWTMEFISDGCKNITGYSAEDFMSNKIEFNNIIHPDYRNPIHEKWTLLIREQKVFKEEYPIITADGETRWIWEQGRGVFEEDGKLSHLEGFITDVSERKLVENALESKMNELMRFQKLTVDRELTMIKLKEEINRLLIESGKEPKYKIVP